MDVFDIIGPVMVGPSSSHTAGAVRIGRMVRGILGEQPAEARITLHGSFARTYKGHGTDKALLGGLLGMLPDDERIRDSMELAHAVGMKYQVGTAVLKDAHPNTACITATGPSGKSVTVQGASVGGGNILITSIDGMDVGFTGEYYTLLISHKDTPGVVAAVTHLLALNEVNIANMKVYRSSRGGDAIMVIETDQEIRADVELQIECLHGIQRATLIEPI